jgi:hypothetical protein
MNLIRRTLYLSGQMRSRNRPACASFEPRHVRAPCAVAREQLVHKRLRSATLAAVVDAPPRSEDGEPLPDLLTGQRHVGRSSAVLSERRSRSIASAPGRPDQPRAAPQRDAGRRRPSRSALRPAPPAREPRRCRGASSRSRRNALRHHFILRLGPDTICVSSVPLLARSVRRSAVEAAPRPYENSSAGEAYGGPTGTADPRPLRG